MECPSSQIRQQLRRPYLVVFLQFLVTLSRFVLLKAAFDILVVTAEVEFQLISKRILVYGNCKTFLADLLYFIVTAQ